ncbi:hypothetical protein Pan258_11000 [Symmachiella dynata]|uniref:hypothetical protein n=1 Tax=Symmachiella dynata TaxID=2527995 RepID=UPI00118CB77F|nr:hypothetical protein [Symmachiella dynata]QDT47073.1 hypothetical protein Pan258_11000 [Symmachiella dynata]
MVSVAAGVLGADLDVVFADWGVTVTYHEVSQAYVPATQQVSEEYTDTEITALVSGDAGEPTRGTAGQHTTDMIEFFVKQADLPAGAPKLTSRIVHQEREYEIVGYANSEDGTTYQLLCRP